MSLSMDRLESIQAARGVAALVVVIYHAAVLTVDYLPRMGGGGMLYEPWMQIGKVGVDLFFVVSGFIMVYTTSSRFDEAGSAKRFAIARISRVYPPYWILSLFVFFYWLYNPSGVNSKTGGVDPVASFLLLPSSSLPLVPVAWTLVHEMFFYLMFFAAIVLIRRSQLVSCLCIWGGAVVLNLVVGIFDPTKMSDGLLLSPFNLEFIGGALLGHFLGRKAGGLAIGLGLMWLAAVAVYYQAVNEPLSSPIPLRVALLAPPCLALVYGIVALEKRGWSAPKWIVGVGDWSYSLYLVHILVLHLVYRVMTRKTSIEWNLSNSLLLAAVATAISIVCGYIYFLLVERRSAVAFSRLLRFLTQRKHIDVQ